jgi:malonyl-CoA O-methyltransferase
MKRDTTTLDARAVRRAFGRAAARYDATAVLQHTVEDRLLERLEYLNAPPRRIVDVGAGPGRGAALLRKRFPKTQVIALDAALPMLRQARARVGWWRPFARVAGDATQLPLREDSVDCVYSNLCLQWCENLPEVFDEFRRVLRPGGLLTFSTFGPGTLSELRAAWMQGDDAPHVSRFADIAMIGDALLAAGFRDPVVDVDTYTLTYADAHTLMRELKTIGATNANRDRARGLTGKGRMARMIEAYEAFRVDGRLPATYEVISAQAFGPDPGQPRRHAGADIAAIPVSSIGRIRR